MLIAGHQHNSDALIEALTIARKYTQAGTSPVECTTAKLILPIAPERVSQEDRARLNELRFHANTEEGYFYSLYFG